MNTNQMNLKGLLMKNYGRENKSNIDDEQNEQINSIS